MLVSSPLPITHADLASQWHHTNDKRPCDVTSGSGYRAKWVCAKDGYVWEASVSNRALRGSGCPVCANRVVVRGLNDLATVRPDVAAQWHQDNDRDADTVPVGAAYRARWVCANGHEWAIAVCNRTAPNGSGCPVCAGKAVRRGVNDLVTTHPDLAREWLPDNRLNATEVSAGSHTKVKWKCAKGHTWVASVASRAREGMGCGKCSGRHVDIGVNDLATLRPDLAAEWHTDNEKNAENYRPGSQAIVKWACVKDSRHVWRTSISNRSTQNTGCPVCANKIVMTGINDLATTHPHLAGQWSAKNSLSSNEVTAGSGNKAWWICDEGHEWKAVPSARSQHKSGCPYCSGRLPILGKTDIATTHPNLVKEWSASNDKRPTEVSSGSDYRAAWTCVLGHSWTTQVKHRALGSQGCPTCVANTYASKGEKELQQFIKELLPCVDVECNSRNVKGVHELDVFIPSLNIGIEYNGLYWHSETAGKSPKYHLDKREACAAQGVTLIGLWEDDWRDRREIVEKMLKSKIGASTERKVNARDTIVDRNVYRMEADMFLAKNHIQGTTTGSVFIGLRERDGNLVALMSSTARRGSAEITRYTSSAMVRGGFTRLLHVLKEEAIRRGTAKIITYSDNAISDGALYAAAGFTIAEHVPPKYHVVWRNNRVHSSSLKRARFRNDPSLKHDPDKSLVDNYRLNNMHLIWDYGKIRWELPICKGTD